jgi:uncharacterized membrane protein
VIDVPFAHVAGMPLEETLASFGPLLFVGFGVAWANFRSRLRARVIDPAGHTRTVTKTLTPRVKRKRTGRH